jgi:transposase
MDILSEILGLPAYLQLILETINPNSLSIKMMIASTGTKACCPMCQMPSTKIHSHYERTLVDLNWGIYQVHWQLWVRKFFCKNQTCPKKIFTERLAPIVKPYARKTQRLLSQQSQIALALGGKAGERLSSHLNYQVSRQTLLSSIRRLSLPEITELKVLGVDDWAYRKGQIYGTILVDLEKHRVLSLLPDREAETLSQWLKAHPGIEIISRDRSKTYKQGTERGAPGAIQVADRFHLLQNLGQALERLFNQHTQDIKIVEKAVFHTPKICDDGSLVVPLSLPSSSKAALELAGQRRTQRKANYDGVWNLHRQEWTQIAIALELGLSESTVRRYLHSPTFPERTGRRDRGRGLLDPYKDYLLKKWNSGCRSSQELFEQLQAQGYQGGYRTMQRYLQRLRSSLGLPPRQRQKGRVLPESIESKKRPLTVGRVAGLVLRRLENRDDDDEQFLIGLMARHSDIAKAIPLARDFAEIVRHLKSELLTPWLKCAIQTQISPLVNFALGVVEDYDAVKAGVTLPWSNGQVEGQVNRLKMLKRQMYGRAGLDLLSRRFLLAS